jgi:hypothetical protein
MNTRFKCGAALGGNRDFAVEWRATAADFPRSRLL